MIFQVLNSLLSSVLQSAACNPDPLPFGLEILGTQSWHSDHSPDLKLPRAPVQYKFVQLQLRDIALTVCKCVCVQAFKYAHVYVCQYLCHCVMHVAKAKFNNYI